jgi:hypothetical protein
MVHNTMEILAVKRANSKQVSRRTVAVVRKGLWRAAFLGKIAPQLALAIVFGSGFE